MEESSRLGDDESLDHSHVAPGTLTSSNFMVQNSFEKAHH